MLSIQFYTVHTNMQLTSCSSYYIINSCPSGRRPLAAQQTPTELCCQLLRLCFAHLNPARLLVPRDFHNLRTAVLKTVYMEINLLASSPAATPVHDNVALLVWLVGRAHPPVFHIHWLKSALELLQIRSSHTHAPSCGNWMFHSCWRSC